MLKLIYLLVLPLTVFHSAVAGDGHWAVSQDVMQNYYDTCVTESSFSDIEKKIAYTLKNKNKINRELLDYLESGLPEDLKDIDLKKVKFINLDGFKFKKTSNFDLSVIMRSTTHKDYYRSWNKKNYTIKVKVVSETLEITRECITDVCKKRIEAKHSVMFDLGTVEKSDILCESLDCVFKKIYGDKKGIYILYALVQRGVLLSRYASYNADKNGFTLETIKAIVLALDSIPEHLNSAGLYGETFYRFIRGQRLAMYGPNTVANAGGAIFDAVEKYDDAKKTYVINHEIGHRVSRIDPKIDLAETDEWLEISGFKEIESDKKYTRAFVKLDDRVAISKYGDTNPREDFAESFSKYRFFGEDLKEISPKRYEFLNQKVFKGLEYTEDVCHGVWSTPAI